MDFQLLGEVQLHAGGQLLDVGTPRQQTVLAALAVNVGRPVPVEALIDRVWDDAPPVEARNALYSYISRIRQLLGRAAAITGTVARIDRRPAGYVLDIDPDLVDLHRFALLAERGNDQTRTEEERAAALTEALGLWRGTPLAGVPGDWAAKIRDGCYRRRLDALLDWGAVQLALGRASAVIGMLPDLITDYPLTEPLEALLMRALHATGRDAEAIDRYSVIRLRLADELGTDPSPELRDLHALILRGELPVPNQGHPLATPVQLPPDLYGFAGRADELRLLDGLVNANSAVRIVAVSGTAGVGKTALAVHWAHRVRSHFPGGQLYVNLRGFDPTGTPVTPAEAVRGFLDAFEVPTNRVPASFEAQVGLYRSLLADRRVLVVLDNARDTEQVRPLLAGSPGCLVLVTSRTLLSGLVAEGAHALVIDLLDVNECLELLAGRLGADRVAAERAVVHEIVGLCAQLPLALAVVAARAATHPQFGLAALADELRAARGGLDEFAGADPATDPRAVFSWSYLQLSPAVARMFRLIGLHSGPDIGVRAAASLASVTPTKVRPLLAELARAHLLTEHRPGRYACHDLLRAYAAEQADAIDTEDDRRVARRRLLAHYIHSADHADSLLDPRRQEPPALTELLPGVDPETMADHAQAVAWFNAEHRVLLSVIHQPPEFDAEGWSLIWSRERFLDHQGHWHDELVAFPVAVAAAHRLGDPIKQAWAHCQLGCTHVWFDRHEIARRELDTALDLFRVAGDQVGQARVEYYHAWSLDRQERNVEALRHAENALELFRAAGHEAGQAKVLNAMAWFHAQLKDYASAIRFGENALELQAKLDDQVAAAQTWSSIGYIHDRLGDRPRAIQCYEAAIGLFREAGYLFGEASVLTQLGDTHYNADDFEAARATWQRAVDILEQLGHPDAEQAREKLTKLTDNNL